jgi:hypothetical protein
VILPISKKKTSVKSDKSDDHLDRQLHVIEGLFSELKDDKGLSFQEIVSLLKKRDEERRKPSIPISFLSDRKLGIFESVVKFLKEENHLTYHEIAILTGRDDRTVWSAYSDAKRKSPRRFSKKSASIMVPVAIFKDNCLGPLETVISYLKDSHKLTYARIASLLSRDDRTVWTSYNQARLKLSRSNVSNVTRGALNG